ncbi:MAG: GNAT family N-acetyltransferase [Ruminococcaceae bacterium]|nr:GNAT family N-acetyltransferase [Oscillospiraceae bacterium]
MKIRAAKKYDIPDLLRLLRQVLTVHHNGRPDLFKAQTEKYSEKDLEILLKDKSKPIFVAVEERKVVGYVFCVLRRLENNSIMTDILTLHIDDLCVDEAMRGKGVGTQLYEYAKQFAKAQGCYNLTLNVWALNENVKRFYEKSGMLPQKIGMEAIL